MKNIVQRCNHSCLNKRPVAWENPHQLNSHAINSHSSRVVNPFELATYENRAFFPDRATNARSYLTPTSNALGLDA